MQPIVCATRGGEASRRTQGQAIALAKERGADLIFLCVVNPDFAEPTNERLQDALQDELQRLGRSLLCIAQARARKKEVKAQTTTRCGKVRQEIEAYLKEVQAGTLVLGAPALESPMHAFGDEAINKFAEEIRQSTDVEVIIVR
jgi:nucleotide-binding universal stress UspA family protein